MIEDISTEDERQRRFLQKYIFELEEAYEKAEEITIANEKLQRSQDLLLSILSGTINGICLLKDRKFVWCNKALTDIIGWEQEEISGKSSEIIFPSHTEFIRMGEHIYDELSKGGLISYEYDYVHKEGHVVPCFVTGRALDENDLSKGHVFSFTDFTERSRQQNALKESEENYRKLVESANSIILRWKPDGEIKYLNPYGAKFFKHSKKAVIGRHIIGIIIPDNSFRKSEMEGIVKGIENNPEKYRNNFSKHMRSDGEDAWVSWTNEPIKDTKGNFIEILSIGNDITRRVKAEEKLKEAYDELETKVKERTSELIKVNNELLKEIEERKNAEATARESEEKYRAILENMEDGYFEVDIEGNFTFFNNALCKIIGYSTDELIGMNYRDIADNANSKKLIKAFNYVLATEKPSDVNEYRILSKDGNLIIIETPISLIRDKNNKPIGFRGLARDVTEQRTLEDRLHRAQKMEAIGTLAGGVAHDLNNILSGIVSYPELILLDLPEGHHIRNPILTIKSSGEKAVAIVQDLLTLARRGVAVNEVVNLNEIISEYLESPEHKKIISFHYDIQVETSLETDLLNIIGSPVHLSKTIMNLVSNAAESMPEGGTVSVKTENRYVDAPVKGYDDVDEGDYAVIEVRDSGIGIVKDDLDKIFEPFYTKKKMGRSGTGLGMAVVWGTVKDHNGYIDVHSIEGKGTVFTLYFPATRDLSNQIKETFTIETCMGKGESILIVDDVKEQREIASRMLEKLGYTIASVSSGEEAVEYIKHKNIDLLVLDMIMDPGIDGLDTYRRILEVRPDMKAIIASGFSETKRVKEAHRLGAGQYVKKPYTLEKIGAAVKAELRKE